MQISELEHINWQRPWLAPWAELGRAVAQRVAQGAHLCDALNAQPELAHTGIRFVPQTCLPGGMAYEQFIFQERCVPTRENLHDFFNGLAWLKFPRIKSKLNALQGEQIAQAGGPLRDALTLIDENAAFFIAPVALCEALQTMDWQTLFLEKRSQWQSAQLIVFGHALLEKLTQPRKPMVAHVLRTWPGLALEREQLDETIAAWLGNAHLAAKPFSPLPVLGVPQWWPENENPQFYDDASVFRAPRAWPAVRNTRKSSVQMHSRS
jgi:hypothetical protein